MIEKLLTIAASFIGVTAAATIVYFLLIKLAFTGPIGKFIATTLAIVIFFSLIIYVNS